MNNHMNFSWKSKSVRNEKAMYCELSCNKNLPTAYFFSKKKTICGYWARLGNVLPMNEKHNLGLFIILNSDENKKSSNRRKK